MTNLVDIPTVVSALVTFYASGGAEAAVEVIKGITVNGALKLNELKNDYLMCKPEVIQAVAKYQQDPNEQKQLEEVLTKALAQHPTFQQQTAVKVKGDINADEGSVAAAVINGDVKITNTFK